mmetsp:Transcript_65554/g.147934  ORF Transcript_65554/g.147934 Transcript_65554/m.147934 type:complete len:218 (-) Transcript_65554:127-780(-)
MPCACPAATPDPRVSKGRLGGISAPCPPLCSSSVRWGTQYLGRLASLSPPPGVAPAAYLDEPAAAYFEPAACAAAWSASEVSAVSMARSASVTAQGVAGIGPSPSESEPPPPSSSVSSSSAARFWPPPLAALAAASAALSSASLAALVSLAASRLPRSSSRATWIAAKYWPYLFPKMFRWPPGPEAQPRQPVKGSSTTVSGPSACLGTRQILTVPNL